MIPRLDPPAGAVPPGGPARRPAPGATLPGTPSAGAATFAALLGETLAPRLPGDDGVGEILQRSFRLAVIEALARAPSSPPALAPAPRLPAAPTPAADPAEPAPEPAARRSPAAGAPGPGEPGEALPAASAPGGETPGAPAAREDPPGAPPDEARAIREAARRAGIDPAFLWALRRVENGGPGREFGVLSVRAPTYDDQVRVAAESVRRSVERFARAGGRAVDPESGRYTEAFVRFFSHRYAPVGAANDPAGLNRHHAPNLLRLYGPLDTRA
jgi:hypothetical protein